MCIMVTIIITIEQENLLFVDKISYQTNKKLIRQIINQLKLYQEWVKWSGIVQSVVEDILLHFSPWLTIASMINMAQYIYTYRCFAPLPLLNWPLVTPSFFRGSRDGPSIILRLLLDLRKQIYKNICFCMECTSSAHLTIFLTFMKIFE